MQRDNSIPGGGSDSGYSRRRFLGGTLTTAAAGGLLRASTSSADDTAAPAFDRKLKIGIVGCGHRGAMIGKLCKEHGGYEIHAVIWLLQQRPVAATGSGRICRVDPHGDARDVYSVLFEYADGVTAVNA
jgi:predicted dehydrogenase